MDSCGGGVAGCLHDRKLWRRNFVAVDLDGVGHFAENALESDFIRRELLAQGNLEFCTLRTDRSLTRWTCPARNRTEFNFLTSTTPADAGASSVPSSAEEGSTAGMGVVLAYANETQKPKEKPLPFPFVGSHFGQQCFQGGECAHFQFIHTFYDRAVFYKVSHPRDRNV